MKYLLVLGFFLWPSEALAYLDGGTGSIVLQAIIAALAGGIFYIKVYWKRVKSFFSRKKEIDAKPEKSDMG